MGSQRNLIVRTCNPGHSDLFQLIHQLVSESKEAELLNKIRCETVKESIFTVKGQVTIRKIVEN